MHGSENNVSNNVILEGGQDGIQLGWSHHNYVCKNRVEKANYGIYLSEDANYNNVTENILINNRKCIFIFEYCEGNYIENNSCKVITISGYNLIIYFIIFGTTFILLSINKKLRTHI